MPVVPWGFRDPFPASREARSPRAFLSPLSLSAFLVAALFTPDRSILGRLLFLLLRMVVHVFPTNLKHHTPNLACKNAPKQARKAQHIAAGQPIYTRRTG